MPKHGAATSDDDDEFVDARSMLSEGAHRNVFVVMSAVESYVLHDDDDDELQSRGMPDTGSDVHTGRFSLTFTTVSADEPKKSENVCVRLVKTTFAISTVYARHE